MLIRLIIIGLVAYWGARLLRSLILPPPRQHNDVHGQADGNAPFSASNHDIEDAEFEEIDD